MSSANTSVLIVGAGPTGLALACVLARRGAAFRIIDKAAEYFAGSRGKGLQPRSLEVLEDLGVIDRVPTPDVPYASPLIIPQWRVEQILRERLAEAGWSSRPSWLASLRTATVCEPRCAAHKEP